MEKYISFEITQRFKKDVAINGNYAYQQIVDTSTDMLVNVHNQSFATIDNVLRVVTCEYKQFLARKKDDNDYSFSLYATVGISNKATLLHLSYYKTYSGFQRYQKTGIHAQVGSVDNAPKTVVEVVNWIKDNLESIFSYASTYDKD